MGLALSLLSGALEAQPVEPEGQPSERSARSRALESSDAPTSGPRELPEVEGLSPSMVRRVLRDPGPHARILGTVALGRGLRLSNPYRLETQLGEDASSLSLTASYLDFGFGIAVGEGDGIAHGGAVHVGTSLSGPWQPYLSPSYLLAYRGDEPFLVTGRLGPVVLLAPDTNVGGEIAGGFSWFFTGALGVTSEVVFDLFYGAATLESSYSVVPVLSAQLGLVIDYEVLP